MNPIYLIDIRLPSENKQNGREVKDSYTVTVKYKFPEILRKHIASLRVRYHYKINEILPKLGKNYFGTMKIINEELKPILVDFKKELEELPDRVEEEILRTIEKVKESEKDENRKKEIIDDLEKQLEDVRELKGKLHEELKIYLDVIKISDDWIRMGEHYQKFVYAIYYKVISDTLERIKTLTARKKQLTERGREAVLKLLDRLEELNFLEDPEVNEYIDNLREEIERDQDIEELKKMLEEELTRIEQKMTMFAFLEL